MSEPLPRFWELFFAVYEALPRQGPGNRAAAGRALALCHGLPAAPCVLDLGCGVGAQTAYLAELTGGILFAVDRHVPSVARLRAAVARQGLTRRVLPVVGDIGGLGLPPARFDLVWSEGALYNLGLAAALGVCRGLLRPGGWLVFTDAVWRTDDAPPEVRATFAADYPTMGQVDDVLAAIAASGLSVAGHFTLPDEAWWDDFYTPMERRIAALAEHHAGDAEALAALAELAREPEMHRLHSRHYAYEFFVARRDT
jgi:SAM-dependent methyltransferase